MIMIVTIIMVIRRGVLISHVTQVLVRPPCTATPVNQVHHLFCGQGPALWSCMAMDLPQQLQHRKLLVFGAQRHGTYHGQHGIPLFIDKYHEHTVQRRKTTREAVSISISSAPISA